MTDIEALPDDYRRPTSGLEMLTGDAIAAQWRDWGYVDGWNWVAEGGGGDPAPRHRKDYMLRDRRQGLYIDDYYGHYQGWNEGATAAARAAMNSAALQQLSRFSGGVWDSGAAGNE